MTPWFLKQNVCVSGEPNNAAAGHNYDNGTYHHAVRRHPNHNALTICASFLPQGSRTVCACARSEEAKATQVGVHVAHGPTLRVQQSKFKIA
jgi:hypothetical protein